MIRSQLLGAFSMNLIRLEVDELSAHGPLLLTNDDDTIEGATQQIIAKMHCEIALAP